MITDHPYREHDMPWAERLIHGGLACAVCGRSNREHTHREVSVVIASNEPYPIDLLAALRSFVLVAREAAQAWDEDRDHRVGKLLVALSGRAPGYRADIDAIHAAIKAAETL